MPMMLDTVKKGYLYSVLFNLTVGVVLC